MKIKAIALCLSLASVSAQAAVTVTTDNQTGPGGAGSTFTPTYSPLGNDLLNGLSPSFSAGDFTVENSGGIPRLTDGLFGTIQEPGGMQHPIFAVAGGGSGTGTELIYSFNTTSATQGFRLDSIVVYGGWNDNGRDQQLFTLSYSTVGAPTTFLPITSVNFNPAIANGLQSATRVTIADNAAAALATNVKSIRFQFTPSPENGHTGYVEIDAIGAAVPEPGSAALLFAALGFAGSRRLRRARR